MGTEEFEESSLLPRLFSCMRTAVGIVFLRRVINLSKQGCENQ